MAVINYPKRITEAEMAADLRAELRTLGYDARMQVVTRFNGRLFKFDIVVFDDEEVAICIIECKSWSKIYGRERWFQLTKNTKQLKKYAQVGLPVFVCGREESKPKVIDLVLSLDKTTNPVRK